MKRVLLPLLLSSVILAGCENTWFGEDEAPPLEGERVSLFNYDKSDEATDSVEIDVKQRTRDRIPMRDITAKEITAIQEAQRNMLAMEEELNGDDDVIFAEPKEETANAFEDVLLKASKDGSPEEIKRAKAVTQAAVEKRQAKRSHVGIDFQPRTLGSFIFPAEWKNAFWPQSGGYSNHAMQHVAFSFEQPQKIWSADIGDGASKAFPLTAQPIIVDGVVYTLDSESQLKAFDSKGEEKWSLDITKKTEEDPVISGGLAFSSGKIFATNGYNEVLAIDPFDGEILWRKALSGPVRAAPSAISGKIFVTTLDNRLYALDAADGSLLWDHRGLEQSAGLLGAASAAANRDIVTPVYSSGEVYALNMENGSVAWADNLATSNRVNAATGLSDIRALPIIDKGLVIAMSYANKLVAIDSRTGQRVWEQPIGGMQTPWVVGNRLFVIDKEARLYGLNRRDGSVVWTHNLPAYKDMEDKEGPITWYGPIFAGNRLMVLSSTGMAAGFDPETGEQIQSWETDVSLAQPPVIADSKMILLDLDGTVSLWQ